MPYESQRPESKRLPRPQPINEKEEEDGAFFVTDVKDSKGGEIKEELNPAPLIEEEKSHDSEEMAAQSSHAHILDPDEGIFEEDSGMVKMEKFKERC